MPSALCDFIRQLADQFLSIRNPKSKIRNRLTHNPYPVARNAHPATPTDKIN
jgi:hypothetical protein